MRRVTLNFYNIFSKKYNREPIKKRYGVIFIDHAVGIFLEFQNYKSPRIYPIGLLHTGQTSRAFSALYSKPQFSHFHLIGSFLL